VPAVHAEVVVNVIVRASVIIVEAAPVSGVICYDEIVANVIHSRDRGGRVAVVHVGEVGQPVPAVKRPVV
jgi:hypothetical protein